MSIAYSIVVPLKDEEANVEELVVQTEKVMNSFNIPWEMICIDDGSKDGTPDAARMLADPRIRFEAHTNNRGAGVVTRELIGAAQGEFIALMNSDDAWVEGKLSEQVDFLRNNPAIGATFGRVRFVDRIDHGVPKRSLQFGKVFDEPNRSRGQWLRHFFFKGNCICHPTMLIRRQCYEEVGVYDNRLRQLPDFEMWVRLVKRFDIHVAERTLLEFRLLPGENASSDTPHNGVRTINEHMLVATTFFDGVSRDLLIDGFSDLLIDPRLPTAIHVDIEKVMLLFQRAPGLEQMYKIVGLQKLYALLASESHRPVLAREYGIDDADFHRRMGEADAFRPLPRLPDAVRRD